MKRVNVEKLVNEKIDELDAHCRVFVVRIEQLEAKLATLCEILHDKGICASELEALLPIPF